MSIKEYVEDHINFIIGSILCYLGQVTLLILVGVDIWMAIGITGISVVFVVAYGSITYVLKHKRNKHMQEVMNDLDKKYLLHEVLPKSTLHEETMYREMLRIGNKAMLEEVSKVKRERVEYQEYIEQWVHEIKTPIAAMKLWSENHQIEHKRDLLKDLERTENYVEQALFYARSETIEKDLSIQKMDLLSCLHESLIQNKYLCTSTNTKIELSETHVEVLSDEKWMIFIVNQIIENAVKYRKHDAKIKLYTQELEHCVILNIIDNGKGIHTQDIPRVFEKGFTGENGRNASKHATGIGLYLCKKMCDALGIELGVESIYGQYTRIYLKFKK